MTKQTKQPERVLGKKMAKLTGIALAYLVIAAPFLIVMALLIIIEKAGVSQLFLGIIIGLILPKLFQKTETITYSKGIHIFDKDKSVCHCGGMDEDGNRYSIPTYKYPNPIL